MPGTGRPGRHAAAAQSGTGLCDEIVWCDAARCLPLDFTLQEPTAPAAHARPEVAIALLRTKKKVGAERETCQFTAFNNGECASFESVHLSRTLCADMMLGSARVCRALPSGCSPLLHGCLETV